MATAILSTARGGARAPARDDGELTLTGDVLLVGGIQKKVIAAKRTGLREPDPAGGPGDFEVSESLFREGMTVHFVARYPRWRRWFSIKRRSPAKARGALAGDPSSITPDCGLTALSGLPARLNFSPPPSKVCGFSTTRDKPHDANFTVSGH
jgi:hypothetical protein